MLLKSSSFLTQGRHKSSIHDECTTDRVPEFLDRPSNDSSEVVICVASK